MNFGLKLAIRNLSLLICWPVCSFFAIKFNSIVTFEGCFWWLHVISRHHKNNIFLPLSLNGKLHFSWWKTMETLPIIFNYFWMRSKKFVSSICGLWRHWACRVPLRHSGLCKQKVSVEMTCNCLSLKKSQFRAKLFWICYSALKIRPWNVSSR